MDCVCMGSVSGASFNDVICSSRYQNWQIAGPVVMSMVAFERPLPEVSGTLVIRTVPYSTVRYSMVQYSTVQYGTIKYGTVRYNTVQYSTVQYGTVWYNTVRYNTVQ